MHPFETRAASKIAKETEKEKETSLGTMSCPSCLLGSVDDGTPTGKEMVVAGVPTYRALPESGVSDHAILIMTDLFGWKLPNARIVADKIAELGYQVYVPDLFNGDPVPSDTLDFVAFPAPSFFGRVFQFFKLLYRIPWLIFWLRRHGAKTTYPIALRVCEGLRDPSYGIKKIAAQGYCYGGIFSILLAASGKVDAFLSIHSAAPKDAELQQIACPGCFLNAKDDMSFPAKKIEHVKQLLALKTKENPALTFRVGCYPAARCPCPARRLEVVERKWRAERKLNSAG
mmetsp:Transcript_8038/g.24163  ORF Transcript_8038/g.24163 Transcript_8038/m.24163 type:complete len:286 (+) Transcript_8038:52-909(+)